MVQVEGEGALPSSFTLKTQSADALSFFLLADKMSKFSYLLACAAGLSGFLFGYVLHGFLRIVDILPTYNLALLQLRHWSHLWSSRKPRE